jgi:hypothetical protein
VIGSARLAERGASAEQILARYYPGLAISTGLPIVTTTTMAARATDSSAGRARGSAPPPTAEKARGDSGSPATAVPRRETDAANRGVGAGVVVAAPGVRDLAVALPDEDAGSVRVVEAQASRARDELARTLGVAPPRVTLRFHPTVPDYERATGMPWFTSATAIGDTIHLSPLAALRDRGILEQTIRRGLVHLMIDAPLQNRPEWVRAGAALYYADPDVGAASARVKCPSENELRQPVSAGALSNAYARAKACVAKQIAAGRSWKDVR